MADTTVRWWWGSLNLVSSAKCGWLSQVVVFARALICCRRCISIEAALRRGSFVLMDLLLVCSGFVIDGLRGRVVIRFLARSLTQISEDVLFGEIGQFACV